MTSGGHRGHCGRDLQIDTRWVRVKQHEWNGVGELVGAFI
jgi:hypothetical protein